MKNVDPVRVFSTLSNQTRLRCLHLVYVNEDVCVCEIVEALGISQPAASKALGALKSIGLVNSRRDANWTYYSQRRDLPDWLAALVKTTLCELCAQAPYSRDQAVFEKLNLRERTLA